MSDYISLRHVIPI